MSSLNALLIDPQRRTIESVNVEPDAVPALLGTANLIDVDHGVEHCLVIADDEEEQEHPARFRFTGEAPARPFFGSALVFGSEHGNWVSATLTPEQVRIGIIWEHWDVSKQRYAGSASTANP